MRGHRSRIRRAVLGCLLMPAMLAIAPQLSAAAGWSTVNLPEHSGLNAVFCRSSRWCEAVGTNHQAQAEHWNGSRWSIEHAVKPAAPRGYRSAHTYLNAIACRGARFCLAVGSLVPVGTGNSPGTPVVERWHGSRWQLQSTPPATGPLDSVSCTSSRARTVAGGWSATVGPDGTPVYDSVTERWNGVRWSPQNLPTPAGTTGDGLLGVSCYGAGRQLGRLGVDPDRAAARTGRAQIGLVPGSGLVHGGRPRGRALLGVRS
jgi:hypothetical protein